MTVFYVVGIWKSQIFKTEYRLSTLQVSLSGSNFMEVSVRPQKRHHDVIMTLFFITEFPN